MSSLFKFSIPPSNIISTTTEITNLLQAGAPVALGVSGGKDSCALAIATDEYLDSIGHTGPRVLIHSDLGRIEWRDSLPTCQRLAKFLDMELIVVRRGAGDMMDRWQVRWQNNVARYADLRCVKLILPWSTPSMRFCTSELKTAIICAYLKKRFPGQTIISAAGIRREESAKRAKAPISAVQKLLDVKTVGTRGYNWHPILEWSKEDVFALLTNRGFDLHEAYTRYGLSRVSCSYCIMSSQADLKASAACADNHAVYRELCDLEITSTFGFQEKQWLCDVAPQLLDEETKIKATQAKQRALRREKAEARIPKHLLYVENWPTRIPTLTEATLLAEVRSEVAQTIGLKISYTDPFSIIARYEELMTLKAQREKGRPKTVSEKAVNQIEPPIREDQMDLRLVA